MRFYKYYDVLHTLTILWLISLSVAVILLSIRFRQNQTSVRFQNSQESEREFFNIFDHNLEQDSVFDKRQRERKTFGNILQKKHDKKQGIVVRKQHRKSEYLRQKRRTNVGQNNDLTTFQLIRDNNDIFGFERQKEKHDKNIDVDAGNRFFHPKILEKEEEKEQLQNTKLKKKGSRRELIQTKSNQSSYMMDGAQHDPSIHIQTLCVLMPCKDYSFEECRDFKSRGFCTSSETLPDSDYYFTVQDIMVANCAESCNFCPTLFRHSNNVSSEMNTLITNFTLQFKLLTDLNPTDSAWELYQQYTTYNDGVFSSLDNYITYPNKNNLEPSTVHTFNYDCAVFHSDQDDIVNEEKKPIALEESMICYDFYLYDSWLDGVCCFYGLGHFELNINNTTIHSGRSFTHITSTSFCIDATDGSIIMNSDDKKEKEKLISSKYPARECRNDECVCDSNPVLYDVINLRNDDDITTAYNAKMNVMTQIILLSGAEKLRDTTTPQYRAACWIVYDDMLLQEELKNSISNSNSNGNNNATLMVQRITGNVIQRYIMALFYFATSPEDWRDHLHFLSSKSVCDWNYIYRDGYTRGVICDTDRNIISINFRKNNLGGTLIEELSGLTLLEQLQITQNKNFHGSIPSSLGQLSRLRKINLFGNSLGGKIPDELCQASKLQALNLGRNQFIQTIPKNIGNLENLDSLALMENYLTGSIPDGIFSMKYLYNLDFSDNHLSSTIPSSVGNLERIIELRFDANNLSGNIPSSMRYLSRMKVLTLNNNILTGRIPADYLLSLPNIQFVAFHNNSLVGDFEKHCDAEISGSISADCRNDIFPPDVNCSCCTYCTDRTPSWEGECMDTTIKIMIDHQMRGDFDRNSDGLEWSLTGLSLESKILYDGPYNSQAFKNDKRSSYEVCIASSDCFTLNMLAPPTQDTNYTIFWNNGSIFSGTFHANEFGTSQTVLTFYHETSTNEIRFNNTTCETLQLTCGESIVPLEPNTIQRIIYNTVLKITGPSKLEDPPSVHVKALCWTIENVSLNYHSHDNNLETIITQRYVFTLLHLTSKGNIFGPDELPPSSHECEWIGIQCSNNKTVTSLSLHKHQTIGSTLIEEIGSLAFLEILHLNQTGLEGPFPKTFSNLYSLRELNFSENKLTGSIPSSFFDRLELLQIFDVSSNDMVGEIPEKIGAYSDIKTIRLSMNKFVGAFPLHGFNTFNLKHFDVSENEFSRLDLSLLLKHSDLETMNLASNFFTFSIQEDFFVLLSKLKYVNVSQNEIGGVIPSSFPENSNMTHLDIHDNRFTSTIPTTLSALHNLHHLNLQGNRLTGSIPSQLNKLKSLKLMALSNNELKGSIPLSFESLRSIESLLLHNNKLSGEAPIKKIATYITDCGFPSESLEPVTCLSCNICCNSDRLCQKKGNERFRPTTQTVIFILSMISFLIICIALKRYIKSSIIFQSFFSDNVKKWNAMELIKEKSVYHFLLSKNKVGWIIALSCGIFQMTVLSLFIVAADIKNESGDLEYTMTCKANSLECEDVKSVNSFGWFIFITVIAVWLLRDLVSSLKLMLLAIERENIDFMFSSGFILLVTLLSAWTSIYYNMAIAKKNTEVIVNAVILLFVAEIDERLYQLAQGINKGWVKDIKDTADKDQHFFDDLIISSTITRISMYRQSKGKS